MTTEQLGSALRILLDEHGSDTRVHSLEWETLLPVARQNAVLVRLSERVERIGGKLPTFVRAAVAKERHRVRRVLELAGRVGENCDRHRIPYSFPKLVQHYPDTGRDIDLVVLRESLGVDRLALDGLRVGAKPATVQSRIARNVSYIVEPWGLEVDIHHGRLGALGEQRSLPALLLEHGRRVTLDASQFTVLSPEQQLVLQGVQKVWGRSSFRLAEVAYTANAIRRGLDWPRVLELATQLGVFHSLSCYLSYAEQIHRDARLGPLLPDSVRSSLALSGWGRIHFRAARFRFPALRVHARLYTTMLARAAAAADWQLVRRLTLAPITATMRRRPASVPPGPPSRGAGVTRRSWETSSEAA